MADDPLARCLQVAEEVLVRTRVGALLDPGDRRSVAMCASWQAATSLPAGVDPGPWASVIIRRRLIDEVRRQFGRTHRIETVPLDGHDVAVLDPEAPVVELADATDLIRRLAGGNDRTAQILTLIAAGATQVEIGRRFGIDNTRVSQILAEVRSRAA